MLCLDDMYLLNKKLGQSNNNEQQAGVPTLNEIYDEDKQLPTNINTTNDANSFQPIVERTNSDSLDGDCMFCNLVKQQKSKTHS